VAVNSSAHGCTAEKHEKCPSEILSFVFGRCFAVFTISNTALVPRIRRRHPLLMGVVKAWSFAEQSIQYIAKREKEDGHPAYYCRKK
jgi:hypothetical protein